MSRKYYTLLVKYETKSPWGIAFGDFNKDVVQQEREDSYSEFKTKLIKTSANQASVDAEVRALNAKGL